MVINHSKTAHLKPLLDTLPPGFVVDTTWLIARGIDPKSIHDYVARGWLERLVRGVYRRPAPHGAHGGGEFWAVVLLSLQRLMNYPVHLGGESALDLAGYSHYLNLGGTPRVRFYGDVPSWLKRLPTSTAIVVRRRTLFGDDPVGIEDFDDGDRALVDVLRWPVSVSSPERAILEALDEWPRHASFDNIDKIFEGLVALRPRRLTALLDACRSVKVRRLFFVFADRHGHDWREYINTTAIDFGSGPRALVDGGQFHPVYRISVPETLMPWTPEPWTAILDQYLKQVREQLSILFAHREIDRVSGDTHTAGHRTLKLQVRKLGSLRRMPSIQGLKSCYERACHRYAPIIYDDKKDGRSMKTVELKRTIKNSLCGQLEVPLRTIKSSTLPRAVEVGPLRWGTIAFPI